MTRCKINNEEMVIKGIDEIPMFSWNTKTKEFYVLGHKFDGVNSIEDFVDFINNLQQENEKLNHYKLLYQKVKERNDKAIEYMKPRFMNCIDNGKRYFEDYEINELYEILKGNEE